MITKILEIFVDKTKTKTKLEGMCTPWKCKPELTVPTFSLTVPTFSCNHC